MDEVLLKAIKKITAKRAKTVIDHILAHGHVTTEELTKLYGYNHAPRAARDVREEGIPLDTFTINDSTGRKIGAYKFGDPKKIENFKLGGRTTFSKKFKKELIAKYGSKCAITNTEYEERYLQIDHRVPFEVAGDSLGSENSHTSFMLLSGEGQRKKSWSCEHCENLLTHKNIEICNTCYWAYPENYTHLAMKQSRRVDLEWSGEEETKLYDVLVKKADETGIAIDKYIMSILKKP